ADRQEVLAQMAELAERGGDPDKAAGLFERCGRAEDACRAYAAAGRLADAARCLRSHLGDEQAAASDEYARLMARAGLEDDLLRLWIAQVEANQGRAPALERRRRALAPDSGLPVHPGVTQKAEAALLVHVRAGEDDRFDEQIG